jgi:hypothetical protein
VTEALVALWVDHAGVSPTDAHTDIDGNTVTCVMVDGVSDFNIATDRTLDGYKPHGVATTLADYKREAVSEITRVTHQRVTSFLSSHDPDTDVATETFTLEASLRQGAPRATPSNERDDNGHSLTWDGVDIELAVVEDASEEKGTLGFAEGEDATERRVGSTLERSADATKRDKAASLRDMEADVRDRTAELTDKASDDHERAMGRADGHGASRARGIAMEARTCAAGDRRRAGSDRKLAAEDRAQAAIDLESAQLDRPDETFTAGRGDDALRAVRIAKTRLAGPK